jgi:hypothetical protein
MKQSEQNKPGGKQRTGARGIVNPDALTNLKKRAEDLGLIIHARDGAGSRRAPSGKKIDKK